MSVSLKAAHKKNQKLRIALIFFIIAVFGCGGGGGGGGDGGSDDGSTNDISYTGKTQHAGITSSNANEMVSDSYHGGQTGENMNPFSSLQSNQEPSGPGRPIVMELASMFERTLARADIQAQGGYSKSAVQSHSDTLPDECGGTGDARYSITYDDATGIFSGSFTFNHFCSQQITYLGSATFSGQMDLSESASSPFVSFTFNFDQLSFTSASDGICMMDGDLTYTFNSGNPTVAVDMLIKNDITDEVTWVDGYTMAYDGQEMTLSGDFYHPQHGRVTITTEQAFTFVGGNKYPSSGTMLITGATGSAGGNTAARFVVLSATACQVTADTDGDGAYDDYDSGEILWTALD